MTDRLGSVIPRTSFLALACVFLLGNASAAIGELPAALLADLPGHAPVAGGGGYTAADDFSFEFELRNDVVYSVSGEATMTDENVDFMALLIGAATGYGEAIAAPMTEFLRTRLTEVAGAGPVALAVESYRLELEVTGPGEPYGLAFELKLDEVPENLFPVSSHSKGPDDARFVIREFSDFQCPFCARFAQTVLPEIEEELLARGDVRFEYHHLPLRSIHANAIPAAQAAECVAHVLGPEAFWSYHDLLFERQQAWQGLGDADPYFTRLASELDGPSDVEGRSDEIGECIDSGRFRARVEDAYRVATSVLGLGGTPTVFLNGYQLSDYSNAEPYLELMELVEAFSVE